MSETNDSTVHEADGHAAPAGPGDVEGLNLRGKVKKPIRFSQNSKYVAIIFVVAVIGIFVYGFVTNGNGKTAALPPIAGTQLTQQGKISTTDSEIDRIVGGAPKGVNDPKNGLPPLSVDQNQTTASNKGQSNSSDPLKNALDAAAKSNDGNNGQASDGGNKSGGPNPKSTDAAPNFDVTGPNILPRNQIVPNAGPGGLGNTVANAAAATGEATRGAGSQNNSLYVGSGNKGQSDGGSPSGSSDPSTQGNPQPRAAALINNGESSSNGNPQGAGGGGVSGAIAFANGQGERPAYSTSVQLRPIGKFELWAGTIIPAQLDTGINTDLPGPVFAHVTQDVYDSRTGQTLLIPKGSRIRGRYNSSVQNGQSRIQTTWDKLTWNDGKFISLDGQAGAEPEGQSGLYADVNDHRGRILTASIFTAIISAGAQILANGSGAGNVTTGTVAPSGQVVEQTIGGNLAQTGQTFINKQSNVPPELTVPKGKPFEVLLDRTIMLPAWHYDPS